MTITTTPRLPTRADLARRLKTRELDELDIAVHEAAHTVSGILSGGTLATALVTRPGRVVQHVHGLTKFRNTFDPYAHANVAYCGPWGQATWLDGLRRPTVATVDALLAAGGRCDAAAIDASGGMRRTIDVPALEHLMGRCWPNVLGLAGQLYSRGEITHDDALAALGLSRDNAPMGLACIKAGERPGTFRIHEPHMRF
ncbi:hypothetical protein MSTE_01814 [Mycobacteroides stephanolepidis]|uniref:Uncharacterized protein n=1 Tax=[Mycobacterium] stephanolepidis TaxID=1520670 RepID=A0A1Z4EW04_9MYCO|nr:hypothetical protein [[Mycobacterium] stephanolepidis]BAX97131.1 hypothetical protein MSTE_01814 [[Mycobacterium] stephanolepidis]